MRIPIKDNDLDIVIVLFVLAGVAFSLGVALGVVSYDSKSVEKELYQVLSINLGSDHLKRKVLRDDELRKQLSHAVQHCEPIEMKVDGVFMKFERTY